MQRCILLVMAVCLCPSLALARTWTNREGKEIVGEFVDATDEKVTLKKSDGKVVTFKLELLSDDDQQFIRGVLARRISNKSAGGEDADSPFEAVDSPKTPSATDLKSVVDPKRGDDKVEGLGTMRDVNETKKKTKPENRQWTDAFGNKTAGKFIRFQGNSVLLLRSGKQVQLDYWQLSDGDQEYLKELCDANGVSHLIPTTNPAEQRNKGPGVNVAGNPGFNSGPAPGISNPTAPRPGAFTGPTPGVSSPTPGLSSSPPPGNSNPEDLARRLREIEEKSRSVPTYSPPPSATAGSSTYPASGGTSYIPPPGYGASSNSASSPPGSSYPTPGSSYPTPGIGPPGASMPGSQMAGSSMPSSSMPNPSMPSSSFPSMNDPTFGGPMMVQEKLCGSCGKVVPSNITAGGTCPHCGVYFSHDDTNGKRANPGIFGGGGGGGGGPSRGVIRGIVVLVVLGIKGFAYMVWRSQRS